MTNRPTPGMADQVTRAASHIELERTGRRPETKLASTVSSTSLILTNMPMGDWCHPIEKRPKVIGLSGDVDIPLPDWIRSVSPHHAQVWGDHRGHWIRDLGSTVGTRVNLIWIDGLSQAKILPGDTINLGDRVQMQVVPGEPTCDGDTEPAEEVWGRSPHDDPTVRLAPAEVLRQMICEFVSPAETELLLWVSRGVLDNEELGRRLHRSPHTVRTQVGSIFRKLGLHSRGEMISWLLRRMPTGHAARPVPLGSSR